MAEEEQTDNTFVYVAGVACIAVVVAGVVYFTSAKSKDVEENPLTKVSKKVVKDPVVKGGTKPYSIVEKQDIQKTRAAQTGQILEYNGGDTLDFTFSPYTENLFALHQCYCGKDSNSVEKMNRCPKCKHVFFCCQDHYKNAYGGHKEFCGVLTGLLEGGFEAISFYMERFQPQKQKDLTATTAMEGWNLICAALEEKIYTDAFQHAKLLYWAGITHAIKCGHMNASHVKNQDMRALSAFFVDAMNFFYNSLEIIRDDPRELEIAPFAMFEIFGLWATTAFSYKESDPQKMEKMMLVASKNFGMPALENLINLMAYGEDHPDFNRDRGCEFLVSWVNTNMNLLTQKPRDLPEALIIVEMLSDLVDDFEDTPDRKKAVSDSYILAKTIYSACEKARDKVITNWKTKPDQWNKYNWKEFEETRQQLCESMIRQAFGM